MTDPRAENTSSVVSRESLTESQRMEMFQLLSSHFENVSLRQFECDLSEKTHVILVRRGERLVGFSTLLVYETGFDGRPVSVVYSGDTIVAPEAWGSTALFRAWIDTVKKLRVDFPRGEFYWLLLTSGFRTYRLLPLFWREFYPRHDEATPPEKERLLKYLAHERFGPRYVTDRGIVRFVAPQRLRDGLVEVPSGRDTNPNVAYFLSRNPGHVNGDELVCLTRLGDDNLTAAGKRMLR